jgi:hypothetical protein
MVVTSFSWYPDTTNRQVAELTPRRWKNAHCSPVQMAA